MLLKRALMNEFKVVVKNYDDKELYIDLPPELLDSIGWKDNDTLEWVVKDDNTIILRKSENDSGN